MVIRCPATACPYDAPDRPSSSPKEDWDAPEAEEEDPAPAWEEADSPLLGRRVEEEPAPADQVVPESNPAGALESWDPWAAVGRKE